MYSIKRRKILIALAGPLAAGGAAHAQEYPTQTIRVVVPQPPGGVVDPAARLMAVPLTAVYAILVVDKNLRDVAQLAERLYVLEKGRVAWTGASSTLCSQEELQHRY